ncbi:MAG: hypothetical protein ACKPKO_30200, partial [Candidatus Fonsibacter sp.]
ACLPPIIKKTEKLRLATPIVSLNSLQHAFCNVAGGESMALLEAAEQLDELRRVHQLTMIPLSSYYLAYWRTLHTIEYSVATAVYPDGNDSPAVGRV